MKEKDLNYIAALEKAVKKKYGPEAIKNPASGWDQEKEESYLEQLKDFVAKQRKSETAFDVENVDGILITRKLLNRERKLNCPVCSGCIKTSLDDVYILKYDCCQHCYIDHVLKA